MVANRLMDGKSKRAGTSPAVVNRVALPRVTTTHAASATKISAGSQVPKPPRFWSHLPTRRPTTFSPTASHSPTSATAAMKPRSSPRWTKRGPPMYAAIAAVATSSDG